MSEIKKIKVAEVTFNREFKPEGRTFTLFYFNLTTEDGEKGEFSTNAREQKKFLVGVEYEVEVTEKSNRGGIYNWFDYSPATKESKVNSTTGGQKKGGGWKPYVRPRSEVMSIIAQSSYEAAVSASIKIAKDKLSATSQIKDIANMFSTFIAEASGLNTPECKTGIGDALKDANQKSIVYQAGLKRAIDMLDLPLVATNQTTQGIIDLTEVIVKDINEIANAL